MVRSEQAGRSLPFPKRTTHAVPQRLQVGIVNPSPFNDVLFNRHRSLEPFLGVIKLAQPRIVAGELIRDVPFVRELVCHGQQRVTGFPRAVEFPQRVRQVERAERRFRQDRAERVRHFRRVIPFLRRTVNLAADLEDFGVRSH